MPVLSNAQWEKFAQELAKGREKTEAYVLAGYKRNYGNASALSHRPEIAERIAEIGSKAADRAAVTIESLIEEAEAARLGAMNDGQWSAAVAAIKEKGVLSGKRIERSERGEPGEFEWLERASDQQLQAFIESGIIPIDSSKMN